MADETPKVEEFKVDPEEFAALKAKAEQMAVLQEQMKAATAQAEEFKAKLAQAEYDRDLDRMTKHADEFIALPVKADELGKRLLDLQRKDADLFGYFDGLLKTVDQQVAQADLFGQRGTQRARTEETFEAVVDQVLKEKFDNDKAHYGEAMQIAQARRPDLMAAYLNQPRGAR